MTVASVIVMMTVTAVTLAIAHDLLTAGKPPFDPANRKPQRKMLMLQT